jgi:hypothetical protein
VRELRYGLLPAGAKWRRKDKKSAAKPLIKNGTLGDLSITSCKDLRLWTMTYDSRTPLGIEFSYSRTPWGPWSELADPAEYLSRTAPLASSSTILTRSQTMDSRDQSSESPNRTLVLSRAEHTLHSLWSAGRGFKAPD